MCIRDRGITGMMIDFLCLVGVTGLPKLGVKSSYEDCLDDTELARETTDGVRDDTWMTSLHDESSRQSEFDVLVEQLPVSTFCCCCFRAGRTGASAKASSNSESKGSDFRRMKASEFS